MIRLFLATLLAALFVATAHANDRPLVIGSKRFTESYVLGEVAAHVARASAEGEPEQKAGLGGTAIVFAALLEGSIDLYPEYTGTIAEVIYHLPPGTPNAELERRLAEQGLAMTASLGFSNTYALAVADARPGLKSVLRISDLATRDARLGLSPEFLGRTDGWLGLRAAYALERLEPRSVDHGLAYDAVEAGSLDVIDVYATDAKIPRFGLRLLRDDRHFFPPYDAVFLYRQDAARRFPETFRALAALAGTIDAPTMTRLNASVELSGRSFREAGESFFGPRVNGAAGATRPGWLARLVEVVREEGPRHVFLVFVSVGLATGVGVPLGILAYRRPRLGGAILAVTGVFQTIPSLALLCFMIPVFGIGTGPALVALFLYGLLPIVRGTAVGLGDLPGATREVAAAIGLPSRARLLRIELPLASRAIFAGVKTSAVINVGTATLAAFVGAGGFGAPISTGLNLNDNGTILLGAVPAAALAIGLQGLFDLLERFVVPEGLRLEARRGRAR